MAGLWDKIKDAAKSPKIELGEAAAVGLGSIANPMIGIGYAGAKGAQLIKNATDHPAKPVKTTKEMLAADLDRLQNDPGSLGLTEAQRKQMIGDAAQQANAAQQAQVSQLGRDALAAQGFQAGAFTQAAQGIADQGQDAAVKAAAGVNQLNQQMIANEKARILSDLNAARERAKENQRYWTQFGINGLASIFTAAMGIPMSPLAPPSGGAITQGGGVSEGAQQAALTGVDATDAQMALAAGAV